MAADLDLRLVRYFTVVAEHRHFGRAAAELHIAQPSLSRQIRRLEHQVGARLLDRTPQGTTLTEAGEVFLAEARNLLRAATTGAAKARAAAEPSRITVGYTTNLIVTPAVRELRRRHPEAQVQAVHLDWDAARDALLEHRADAVVARLPFATDGLRITVLYDEPRVLLVPLDHPLVGKESVTLADIAEEPMPRVTDAVWNAFWQVDPRPDGPLVRNVEDKFELIADGQLIAIVPDMGLHRPDLTTIPLAGVDPCQVVLATRAGDRNRLVADLCRCAPGLLTSARSAHV